LAATPKTLSERALRSIQQRNLMLVWLAQTITAMSTMAFGVLAPLLQTDLGISRVEIGLLAGSFNVVSVLVSIPAGFLSDRFGPRRVLSLCLVEFSILFFVGSLAPTYLFLLAPAILAGFGFNAVPPSTTKAVNDWFPARIRATAMGIKQTGMTAGGMLTGLIVPSVALLTNWRGAIVFLCGLAFALGIAIHLFYTDRPASERRATGIDKAELLRFFTNRNLVLIAFAACMFNVCQSALTNFLSLYLNQTMALPIVVGGFYIALIQGVGIAGRVGWGTISDRLLGGKRRGGLAALAASGVILTVAMMFLSSSTPVWVLGLLMIFGGFTFMSWAALYVTITAEIGGKDHAGLAAGAGSTISVTGLMFGPPLFGAVVDLAGSYTPAWLMLSGMMVVSLVALLLANERKASESVSQNSLV
jgi:sugar phosphate permease